MPPSRQTGKVSMAFQESCTTPEWYLIPRAAFALIPLPLVIQYRVKARKLSICPSQRIYVLARKCFAQLLDDPTAGRMRGDVEVQDTTPVMVNDEKAVEQVESDGGDSKEVHGGNGFAMIVKTRKQKLRRFRISGCAAHPAGDRTLRYIEAEHEEFAVDARRTPGGIFNDHLKDQVTDFFGNSLPAAHWVSGLAQHGPVQSESSAVPAHNCLGHDEEERLFPLGPELASGDPKELVEQTEFWFGMSAF
jgi:hypothetical protein